MRRLIYVPLEPLTERYTSQLSRKNNGWIERQLHEKNIPYLRIEGRQLTDSIVIGSVLDANGRGYWALSQIQVLLSMAHNKEITSDDVIYFDDFWHPGISALAYSFSLTGVSPKMYAMLHAQSVDKYDFSHKMKDWIRHFEIGIGRILSGIFVTSTILKELVIDAGIGSENTVHITGLPYCSEEVKEHFPSKLPERKKQVVFCSRWDSEKNPLVFLDIAKKIISRRNDIDFIVTTSSAKIRSNSAELLEALFKTKDMHPSNFFVKEGLSKKEYYKELLSSKIQINTADQDFVSWTLLESTTCGCYPVYPYYRSFPEALDNRMEFFYHHKDVESAVNLIESVIDLPTPPVKWVYERYDSSFVRMLTIMRGGRCDSMYSY